MGSTYSSKPPKGLNRRIREALRTWHSQEAKGVLDDLLLARHIQAEQKGLPSRLITNQIILNGFDRFKQIDEVAADLLKLRFFDWKKAREVASLKKLTQDVVFQRQRAAITKLTEVIWAQEEELRQSLRQRIEARLESPTYTRLFGIAEQLAEARRLLKEPTAWIMSVEGMGGVGKTSFADVLARELAGESYFYQIAWISARRRLFRPIGEIETLPDRPNLTLAELTDRCIDQFELIGLRHQSDAEKVTGLKSYLKAHPCLIILDNLETVADAHTLISQLIVWVNPSKVLITTRHSLRDTDGVFPLPLKQLSKNDSLALIRHEAQTRGLPELVNAAVRKLSPIYTLTGGNPLAIKLIVGQIHTLSLPTALSRFSTAKGKPTEELLNYLYASAWQALDDECRQVLQAMLFVTEDGGRIRQITATAGLAESVVSTCLHRLAVLCLVIVSGDVLRERRYALHPLTRTFVASQAAADKAQP